VEGLAVPVGQVGQVVHRLGDVVHRHHVRVAEVDADQRQPRRQAVAHHLHGGEEVVGTVDLVHRAGLGVADHDRGPVDAPRHGRFLADDLLRLVLRPVVRRRQVLALLEHGLVEGAVVVTGRGDRRHLVEAAHLERLGQLEGVAGAVDVHRLVGGRVRGHVVDRGQVEEVVDLAPVLLDPRLVDAEPVRGQVADDGDHTVGAPRRDQRLHAREGRPPAQDVDRALAVVDELGDEVPSDEPRGAGDEVRHGGTLPTLTEVEEVAQQPSRNPVGDGFVERSGCGDLDAPVGASQAQPGGALDLLASSEPALARSLTRSDPRT
jgi:hypothetical protein